MMHFSCSVDFNALQEKTSGFLAYRVSSQRSFQVMSQNQNQRYQHAVLQNMQYYRTCCSAEYAVLQNMLQCRICSIAEHAVLQNMQYYKTCSIIEHVVLQNMQYHRTCSITEHAVLQNMQYYKAHSITEHAVLQKNSKRITYLNCLFVTFKLIKKHLTLNTLPSVCIFSILFHRHILRC